MRKLLLLAALLPACVTDEVPVTESGLVGTWYGDELLRFLDDGTFTTDTETGTYAVEDGRVRLDFATGESIDQSYFTDGQLLLMGTLTPDDTGSDAIATWTGSTVIDGDALTTELTVLPDGTAIVVQISGPDRERFEGTWTERELESGSELFASFTIVNPDTGSTTSFGVGGTRYGGVLGSPYEPLE